MKHPSRAVARCGSADWYSFMVLHIFLQFRNSWTCFWNSGYDEVENSMACSFPWFKSL
jgi:hypothetical protein